MAHFHVGASVQYYSTSHGCWIDAVVEDERENGDVQVTCKKGYWMPPAEQLQRLRAQPSSPAKLPSPAEAAGPAAAPDVAGGAAAKAAGGGYPKAAAPAAAAARGADPAGEWAADQAIGLGLHGANNLGSWAKSLDRSAVSSVHAAVEKLNQAEVRCAEDFCVVYSASSQGHYLLYRRGSRDKALAQLMQHLREVSTTAASMREELARLREAAKGAKAPTTFESMNSDAASRLEAASEEVSRLHATLAEETARGAELQLVNEGLRRDLSQMQEMMAATELDVARLRAALDEERGQRKSLQDEHDQLLETLSNKQEEALKQAQSGEDLKAYLKAAEEELSLQTALEDERVQRKALEERETELQAQVLREAQARDRAEEELEKVKAELLAKQHLEASLAEERERRVQLEQMHAELGAAGKDLGKQIPCTAPSLAQRREALEPMEEAKATDVRKERRDREEKVEKEEREEKEEKEEKAERSEKEEKGEKEEKEEGLLRESADAGGKKAEACESKAEGTTEARHEKLALEEKFQEGSSPERAPDDGRGEMPAAGAEERREAEGAMEARHEKLALEEKFQEGSSPERAPDAGRGEVPAAGAEERREAREEAPQQKAKGDPEEKLEMDRREQSEEELHNPKLTLREAKADLEEKLPEGGLASSMASSGPPDPPPALASGSAAAAVGTLPVSSVLSRENPFAE